MQRQRLSRRCREMSLLLLLVVHGDAGDLFAGRVGRGQVKGPCLAVLRYLDFSGGSLFAAFLVGQLQGAFVDHFVGPRIQGGVAGAGIIFTVELAGPLGMFRLAIAAGAIGGHFDVVADGCIGHGRVFYRAGWDLRFGFVEFPCAHLWTLSERLFQQSTELRLRGAFLLSCRSPVGFDIQLVL